MGQNRRNYGVIRLCEGFFGSDEFAQHLSSHERRCALAGRAKWGGVNGLLDDDLMKFGRRH
jgi:hypothetical protein